MSGNVPWPGSENPIVEITFQLIVGFDDEGQPVYRQGQVDSQEELRAVQSALEPLQPRPASISSVTMGKVWVTLADRSLIAIRPVFHPSLGVYRDLFKVDNSDFPMPAPFADLLNRWRRRLIREM